MKRLFVLMNFLISNYEKKIIIIIFIGIGISCSAQNCNSFNNIEGRWLININSNDVGLAKTIFTFETESNTFVAYTRKKATSDILGFWKSSLVRIFTNNFTNGSLLNITEGRLEEINDTILLKGLFRSAMGNYNFIGKIVNDSLTANLTNRNHKSRGSISGHKTNINSPLFGYPEIINEVFITTKDKIFNPEILETKEWKKFEKIIKKKSHKVMDDIELIFSFYYFASNLPISHYYLIKTQPLENSELEVIPSKRFVSLDDKSETTAYLKIKSFNGTANEMDSIFSVIKKKNYLNLIVDLRNNIGGNVEAGMEFAKNVVDTTIIGGIFLTQKWFANHKNIPELNEYNQFHHFTASNYDLLKQGIHEKQGIVLKVIPNKDPFKGQLFILTNNNTASTCEPIVYSLKNHNRATIIGESTAGAMLSGESFDLQNDYSLFVPTADYYTSDGYRIDQKGVKPNIEIKADQALEYVLNNLIDP